MAVYISKVYTKAGDGGQTSLVGGRPIGKGSDRIEAYGTIDELNAVLSLCRRANQSEVGPDAARGRIDATLERVQSELFSLGSQLATLPEDLAPTQPRIGAKHTTALEHEIDELNAGLGTLRSFTVPGGSWTSSYLHLARTVCRRAERVVVRLAAAEPIDAEAVRYLNRLSDALFVLGRWNVHQRGEAEPLWIPERPEAGET